jgi:hypothetical protein
MATTIKIITFKNLDKTVKNMYRTFAPISIEEKIVNTEISPTQPENQDIGDIWFIENTERTIPTNKI